MGVVMQEDGTYIIKGKTWALPPRFKVLTVLGSGAYGCVCLASERKELKDGSAKDRQSAIKRIEDVFVSKTDALRILREISILRRLRHKNIVRLLNVFDPSEPPDKIKTLYVLFEYAGMDLHKFISGDRQITLAEVKKILKQLCEGLRFLHRSCVIHRDLKPANILIDADTLHVKIADFGLARVLEPGVAATTRDDLHDDDEEDDAGHDTDMPDSQGRRSQSPERSTSPERVPRMKRAMSEHVVTRWYRAPEVILCRGHYAQSIDIWSLGCIFAELINIMNVSDKKRRPLFPGRSCFPLSPSSKNCLTEVTDQLNTIFAVVGTPRMEEIEMLDAGSDVKGYLRHLQPRDPIDLQERYPHAPADAIKLLGGLLRFTASARTSLDEALSGPFLASAAVDPQESSDSLEAAALQASLAFSAAMDLDGDDELEESDHPNQRYPQLVRSDSLMAAKELLQLQLETKYDKRNHAEAVQKLNGLFRAEISGFHQDLGLAAKRRSMLPEGLQHTVLTAVSEDDGRLPSSSEKHKSDEFVDALSPAQAS